MRLIRTLLVFIAILLALVALLIAAAFLPPIQTWLFQTRVLDPLSAAYPGLHATIESVSAGLSSIELTNLKLERNGVVLTAPDVMARLPLKTAVLEKKVLVSHLVAKGWRLALGREPGPVIYDANGDIIPVGAGSPTGTSSAATTSSGAATGTPSAAAVPSDAAHRLQRLLSGWQLPFDGTVDGVELEGDVLVPPRAGSEPLPLHVVAQGGGLAAGRTGTFVVSGSGPTGILALPEVNAAGRVTLRLTPARQLDQFSFNGTVSPAGQSRGIDLAFTLNGLAGPAARTVRVAASRNDRHLASIDASLTQDSTRLSGTWKIDFGPAVIAHLWPDGRVPFSRLTGDGTFDSDVDFTGEHVAGTVNGTPTPLAELAPALTRLGRVVVAANFEARHTGGATHIEKLAMTVTREPAAAVAGATGAAATPPEKGRILAVLTAKQPFTVSDATRHPTPSNANADWLDASLHDCPLAILPPLPGGYSFGRGDATGDFTIMAVNGGYGVRANGPIEARGVTIRRGGRVVASGLDLSLALRANNAPGQGWIVQAVPLRVSRRGHELVTVTAKMPLRRDEYGRFPVTGTWTADFDAVRDTLGAGIGDGFNARTGSGEFTANIGVAADLTGKVNLVGHDANHTVSATISGSLDDYRSATFEVPIRIAFGANASDITVSGTCVGEADGPRLDLQVGSPRVTIEQLKWFAAVVPALREAFLGDRRSVATGTVLTERRPPDRVSARPFWGTATGRVRFDIQRVIAGAHEWDQLGGTFELQHGSLTLHGGRIVYNPVSATKFAGLHQAEVSVEPHSAVTAEVTLAFDPAAALPYDLEASGTVDGVNVAQFLAPVGEGQQPTLEGRFAVADTITATGRSLADVVAHRQEEFRLTSDTGIARILKTNVAAALPNPDSKVGDAVAGVGSAVSSFFGHKLSGNVKVDPRTDAVLNFSYSVAEIGFEHFTATATRQPDGSFRLSDIDIRSPHEHVTGSGAIANSAGPVAARPLTLALKLGVKGINAERLAQAGLLAADKDALGYAIVRGTIHLGGTINQVDNTAWRDLLARSIMTPRH